ncbi:hypothetical protein DPMN_054502 [Dreissena polymorpha]|uniref:VWFA domain-containing protein n=1 Tax=Dreissena polymorpha TaxID=45954 RepID=A0A9D4HRA2_DREPO|nr:hypothetical protein DPMN_054502 [Dreissena polymorpha]
MPTVKQGAIGFGTTVIQSTVIELNSFSTYLELYINFMSKMVPDSTSMGTGTFDAIQRGTNIFSSIVGEKIMIIFTDGKSDNPALTKTVCY